MKASDSAPLTWVRVMSALVAASALPQLWTVAAFPINKGTVYVGPITLWLGISVVLWVLCSVAALATVPWVHFRRYRLRRQSWYALAAGECAFVTLTAISGSTINRFIGGWAYGWSDLIFVAVFVGLVVSLTRQSRVTD